MSVPSIADIFDILTVKRTELLGDAKSVFGVFFNATGEEDPNDPIKLSDDETVPSDMWQNYGFISRPPAGAQALIARVGANIFTLASRALAAIKVFGQLAEGDVAMYSEGGNVIRLNKKGDATILIPTESGKQLVVHFSNKGNGSIKAIVPPGIAIEVSEDNGILLNAGEKDVTIAGKQVQIVAQMFVNESGSVKLHKGAVAPFPGGSTSKPMPNVFT